MFAEDSVFLRISVMHWGGYCLSSSSLFLTFKTTSFLNCVTTMRLSLWFRHSPPSLQPDKLICLTFFFWDMPFPSADQTRCLSPARTVIVLRLCLLLGVFDLSLGIFMLSDFSFDSNKVHAICHLQIIFSTRQFKVIIKEVFISS